MIKMLFAVFFFRISYFFPYLLFKKVVGVIEKRRLALTRMAENWKRPFYFVCVFLFVHAS